VPMEHIRFYDEPTLRRPVLLMAFAGWNDASEVATTSVRFLIDRWDARKFADVDPEDFYNFVRVRPHVQIDEDSNRLIIWPSNAFHFFSDPMLDRDFVLLLGIEPNLKWRTFTDEVISVCRQIGIVTALSLGGLVADVPHTRAARVTAFSSDPELTERFPELGIRRSRYEGPTGIVGVLSAALAEADIPVGSLWGNVPHYISASPNPKVVHALLSRLSLIFDLGLELTDMERAGRRFERQVDEALAHNPEVAQYVKQLEAREDQPSEDDSPPQAPSSGPVDLPRGEDIVRQLEEYLRERSSGSSDDDPEHRP